MAGAGSPLRLSGNWRTSRTPEVKHAPWHERRGIPPNGPHLDHVAPGPVPRCRSPVLLQVVGQSPEVQGRPELDGRDHDDLPEGSAAPVPETPRRLAMLDEVERGARRSAGRRRQGLIG